MEIISINHELMRYSLLSRFQGALLGAALGESLGIDCWAQRSPKKHPSQGNWAAMTQLNLSEWRPDREDGGIAPSKQAAFPWGKVAIRSTEKFIQTGNWQGIGWDLPPDLTISKGHGIGSALAVEQRVTGAELAIATLPMALFFHDNPIRWQQALTEVAEQWLIDAAGLEMVRIVSQIIAQALKEQIAPSQLIPQLVNDLQQNDLHQEFQPNLVCALEQVQILVQSGASLRTAIFRLQSLQPAPSQTMQSGMNAICLALYCFLSTPHDIRLALLRAAQSGGFPQVVCGLTGALLGAHNSIAGLPLTWRLGKAGGSPGLSWGVTGDQVTQLATQLFWVWSGVYELNLPCLGEVPAIAAPGVIRLR